MKKRLQSGVSYIEFTVGFAMMMMIAFFLVDAAAVLYHYHVLTDRTASFAREISASIPADIRAGDSCANLAQLARAKLNVLKSDPLIEKLNLKFDGPIDVAQPLDSPYPAITVHGTWRFDCIICKFIGPNLPTLHADSRVIIEDSKVNIGGFGCQG